MGTIIVGALVNLAVFVIAALLARSLAALEREDPAPSAVRNEITRVEQLLEAVRSELAERGAPGGAARLLIPGVILAALAALIMP